MEEYLILKFDELETEKEYIFELENYSSIRVNELMFKENTISKIRIVKHEFEEMNCSVFIEGYLGHIEVFAIVTSKDYTFITQTNRTSKEYVVRPTRDYDYKIVEKQK